MAKYCVHCGAEILETTEICPKCGSRVAKKMTASKKSKTTALLLSLFLGYFGAHRFYVGKIGTGIAEIFLSFLSMGIWPLVDFIMICCNDFTDKEGKPVMLGKKAILEAMEKESEIPEGDARLHCADEGSGDPDGAV